MNRLLEANNETVDHLAGLITNIAATSPLMGWSGGCRRCPGGADIPRGTLTFEVTVRHADTGWEHYADMWEILAPDGTVLGTRVLHHPHTDEQPFTRSLSGIVIPSRITRVTIRAHDTVHGWSGKAFSLVLPEVP